MRKTSKSTTKATNARLMKSDLYGLTRNEEIIKFYREHPVEAAHDILNLKLTWFQRIQLRELWTKSYCLLKWSRGTSKTFTMAMYSVLRAILFPNVKIGIIPPSFRQTGYVFDEIDRFYNESAFFRSSVKRHSRSNDRMLYEFFNSSFIEGLPIGNDGKKIRGRRYTCVILDEYASHNGVTINLVVRPFLAIRSKLRANQVIISSTPEYKTNHFFSQYLRHKSKMKSDSSYSYTYFNFLDIMLDRDPEFVPDLNLITQEYEDLPADQFLMEWVAIFPSEGAGFFSSKLITSCEPRINEVQMEMFGDSEKEYFMGIDPARSEDGDNFALSIMKHCENDIRHLVRVVTTRGKTYPELHDLIREQIHIRKFNISKICMDYGGGGKAIADLMMYGWEHGGTVFPPIVETKSISEDISKPAGILAILELVNFNQQIIDYLYNTFKADMEHKRVLFPLTIRRDMDDEIEKTGKEFAMLKAEMQHLVPKITTNGLVFIGHPKIGKDRITSTVLANHAANLVYKKTLGLVEQEEVELPVGFWLKPR